MALIPSLTGFLENPLTATLFGNNKEIATATISDTVETNTSQLNLLPGSLATGIAINDTLELTSPAKLKFQTDAVIQVGSGNNLVVDGIPVAPSPPTEILYYDTTNQRVTFGANPSSGSAPLWSTIPALDNVNMNGFSLINANTLSVTGSAPVDINMGTYTANASASADLTAGVATISATPTQLTVEALAPNNEIRFNGPVALANGLAPPGNASLVVYNDVTGTEWSLEQNFIAPATNANNIQGPAFSVFTQTAPNTTLSIPAKVGETFLAVDSQNRIQWLTQNTQALHPTDMFPENSQEPLNVGAAVNGKYRSTVMGPDGLVYCTPTSIPPRSAASIDPTTNAVNDNVYNVSLSNSNVRHSIVVGSKIYGIPTSSLGSGPFFWSIYDTLTKTIDNSTFPAGWPNLTGPLTGAPNAEGTFIYLPPLQESGGVGGRVRKFNVNTGGVSEIGGIFDQATYGGNRWGTATLCPDGSIICLPFNARRNVPPVTSAALKIDTFTDTVTEQLLIGTSPTDIMCLAACLSPDGNFVYGAPYNAAGVIKWDWRNNTFSFPAGLATGAINGARFGGIAAAPNGLIYLMAFSDPNHRVFDPATDTFVASIPTTNSAVAGKYFDGCFAPNGKIYCAPNNANDGAGNAIASVIKTGIPTLPAWMLGPGLNQV